MTTVPVPARLYFDAHAPAFSKALAHLDNATTKEHDRVGFDRRDRGAGCAPGCRSR
jgi:hypothetical protein